MKSKQILKALGIFIASIYIYNVGQNPLGNFIIHSIHLVFHEAGHFFFQIFGNLFIVVTGGTIFQLFIPIVFLLYFFFTKRNTYASAVMFLWLGSSLFDVAIYAKDAIAMNLDLLGGDSSIHDWNFMLSNLDILKYTPQIASFIYSLGVLSVIVGAVIGIYSSFAKEEVSREEIYNV